jgi:hypothetical protein
MIKKISDTLFGIWSLCLFAVKWVLGYVWCQTTGHKFTTIHYSKKSDGSYESLEICERCLKTRHTISS